MTHIDHRQRERRQRERRIIERRNKEYPFGSRNWVDSIKTEYCLWPKQNRRSHDRRHHSNRIKCRRQNKIPQHFRRSFNSGYPQNLLTDDEKKLLIKLSIDEPVS